MNGHTTLFERFTGIHAHTLMMKTKTGPKSQRAGNFSTFADTRMCAWIEVHNNNAEWRRHHRHRRHLESVIRGEHTHRVTKN